MVHKNVVKKTYNGEELFTNEKQQNQTTFLSEK